MQVQLKSLVVVLSVLTVAPSSSNADQPDSALKYLKLLEDAIEHSRQQLSVITASAESAAQRLLSGGSIWAGGRQRDFAPEAGGRAGGLMFVKGLAGNSPASGDIVLYAVPGRLCEQDRALFETWPEDVQVVTFSSDPDAVFKSTESPGLRIGDVKHDQICPTDTVVNIINMWAWTGELTSAFTRRGKMPILYQSIGIEGGLDRIGKYSGQTFHKDMQISPIPEGKLFTDYLDAIDKMLGELQTDRLSTLQRAAQWWRNAGEKNSVALTIGHMFPAHFQDERAPQRCTLAKNRSPSPNEKFALHLGYQRAPQNLIDEAVKTGRKLVYASVERGKSAETAKNVVYFEPGWPLPDSCVEVPGYDIPILPASGVINAAIYWAVLAEVCAGELE